MSEAPVMNESQVEQIIGVLTQQEQQLRTNISETVSEIDAIRELKKNKMSKALIHIGRNVMVKATISSDDTVGVAVGANVIIEKSLDDTLNFLESRIKNIEIALTRIMIQQDGMKNALLASKKRQANSADSTASGK